MLQRRDSLKSKKPPQKRMKGRRRRARRRESPAQRIKRLTDDWIARSYEDPKVLERLYRVLDEVRKQGIL